MSNLNISLTDKTSILNKYLETFKNIKYLPFFYKLLSISPVDLYELFFGEQNINLPNFISSESFVIILNYLFIDINILYDYLYNKKYKSTLGNTHDIINKYFINFEEKIKNDTEKVYSANTDFYGIVNIINNNKNNNLVQELIKIYPYFDIENNKYYKETKFLSIVNFIDIISLLLNKEYSTKEKLIDIFIFIVENNLNTIDYCIKIYENLKNNSTDNNIIIDKLDYLLNEYSSDTVLSFLKIRSDNNDDYNSRFNYKLYKKNVKQKKLKIDETGKITSSLYDSEKSKIMKLNYNNDDFNYYEKKGDKFIPNTIEFEKIKKTYKDALVTSENYIIPEDNYKYTYIFGPFSEIYDYKYTNKEISNRMDIVINSLIKQKPVLIIGYGASGAGKTSTLIYFNKGNTNDSKNGILVHLCNRMAKEHNFNKIKLKCREFYVEESKNTPDVRYFPNKKNDSIEFIYNENENIFKLNTFNSDKNYIYKNKYIEKSFPDTETVFNENSSLGEIVIHLIDNDRFVAATTNNPNSSRSHSLIFVELIKYIKNQNGELTEFKSNIIIGDFAGVENLFDCDSDEFKEKFNNIIRDDIYLDDSKKNKIKNKIENLKLSKIIENTEKSNLIKSEIDKLNKILTSFEKKEYYYKYPIEKHYEKLNEKYNEFQLSFDNIINKIYKNKNYISTNKTDIQKETSKPFQFDTDKKINKNYYENTNKYIKDIINQNYSQDIITNNFVNILQKLKNKSTINLNEISEIEKLLFLIIFGVNNLQNDIQKTNKKVNDIINMGFNADKKIYKYVKYFVDTFNKIKNEYDIKNKELFEKNKQLEYGKEVCLVRRNEGIFINNSLKQIRNLINYIIIEKNKYKLTISPPFVNECLNFYCNKDTCFKIKQEEIYNKYNDNLNEKNITIDIKNNLPFNSIIFNTIVEEIGIKVKDLIISVFCVFNISKGANNPPPVPYIDINKIKYLYNNKKYDKLSVELQKISCYDDTKKQTDYSDDCILLNYNKQKIKNILIDSKFQNFMKIKDEIDIILNSEKISKEKQKILNNTISDLFNIIDNFNSASAVGTLEFVDSLSKYNTITNICNKKNFTKEQSDIFEKNYS